MKHNTVFYSDEHLTQKEHLEYYVLYLSVGLQHKQFSTGDQHQNQWVWVCSFCSDGKIPMK